MQILYLVCDYLPGGNAPGVKPFKKGPECSDCESGAGWCKDKLCNRECTGPGKDCTCMAGCYNCATLDEKTCRCSCADGWTGAWCKAPCKDTDVRCDPLPGEFGWPPYFCDDLMDGKLDAVTANALSKGCPVMCMLCNWNDHAVEDTCPPVFANNDAESAYNNASSYNASSTNSSSTNKSTTATPSTASSLSVRIQEAMMRMLLVMIIFVSISSNAAL